MNWTGHVGLAAMRIERRSPARHRAIFSAKILRRPASRIRGPSSRFDRVPGMTMWKRPMIIDGQEQVTDAVLAELTRAPNPRLKEIMAAFVRHLHDFAREVKLTEEEFQTAVGYIVALGK